jgi:multicomponent Na+:H+ antiporter subunit F
MSGAEALEWTTLAALWLLGVGVVLGLCRIVLGPTLADRVLALDLISTLTVGVLCTLAVRFALGAAVDIAVVVALVGFVSTAAFARYLLATPTEEER